MRNFLPLIFFLVRAGLFGFFFQASFMEEGQEEEQVSEEEVVPLKQKKFQLLTECSEFIQTKWKFIGTFFLLYFSHSRQQIVSQQRT